MKTGITLLLLTVLLNLACCSGDNTEKKSLKPEANKPSPVKAEPAEPYPNSPSSQDLQPDSHISGGQNNHTSGAVFPPEHLSGQ
jgi:hypothetical protein